MGHNGKDEVMVHEIEASQCAMVEINIKTLDSQMYTLRVDKCVPVPALKEQIASVTGVVTEQQRLICRGKVMKDDQLLSAYHVEDGHTLHLVVRQPIPLLSESSTSNAAADPALSAGDSQGSQRSRVVVGSFNIAEQGDFSDFGLGHIVSAVLGSLGISNAEGGIEGLDAMGPLHERLSRSTARDSSGGRSVTPNAEDQSSTPLTASQPAAIPDSLTTLSEYLTHLRQEFAANGSNANNGQDSGNSMGNVQDSGSTIGESRIPRPSHLADVMQSTRQLLIGDVADCLSNLSRQLVDQVNVTDPSTRRSYESNMLHSGSLLENVGISLLELGRATMMLHLGQTPDDAVVNTGPAVFISPTGRNPLPSHSSRLGTSIGGLQAGTAHSLASVPRNIEIRIRTGSWVPSSGANQREESTTPQAPGQSIPSAPSGNSDSVPSMRGPSDPPRNPVALVIPVMARYQQVSLGERSATGLDGVHQPVAESPRQPQSAGTPVREGDSSSAPGGLGLSELRNRINQFLRPLSRRDQVQVGSRESQVAANPPATASTETNEAVANAQAEPASGTDEGNFLSSVLQQIMPLISQNVPSSSSDEAAGRGSNSSRQASSREGEEGAERGNSSRRPEPPSHPDSKRQKRE
uniref:Large proline-rich protein bag6 n=1 Tax=Noccaea caerulescens TaxID=107243 RepID=A0A1J3G960_NOCCA